MGIRKLFGIIVVLLLTNSLYCFGQSKTFTISSKISNLTGKTFSLTIWNGLTNAYYKDGTIKDGQIYYQDTTSIPLIIRITLPVEALFKNVKGGFIPVKSQSIWLVAMPGGDILLEGKLSDYAEVYPSGDKENKVISALNKGYHPLINKSANISVKLANDTSDAALTNTLTKDKKEIDQASTQYMNDFLKKNASSIAGLYYLEDMLMRGIVSMETVEAILPTISKPYRKTHFFKSLENRVAGSKYSEGRSIFQISTSKTYDGKPFDSNSWKGKFYLIDFWGSWCVPCLEDIPALKSLRDSYPDQLNILGIASDQDANWRKAIEEHELNWVQILNDKGEENYVSRLNITGFPTKILVDPNGKIVYRSTGGGETSFQKMGEIIKNWK